MFSLPLCSKISQSSQIAIDRLYVCRFCSKSAQILQKRSAGSSMPFCFYFESLLKYFEKKGEPLPMSRRFCFFVPISSKTTTERMHVCPSALDFQSFENTTFTRDARFFFCSSFCSTIFSKSTKVLFDRMHVCLPLLWPLKSFQSLNREYIMSVRPFVSSFKRARGDLHGPSVSAQNFMTSGHVCCLSSISCLNISRFRPTD